jgi:hypothetical protein
MSGDDLLRQSIGKVDNPQRPIYSATAGYLTAFFGGPFAAVGMAGLNAWRLGRLRTDALALAGCAALAVGLITFLLRPDLFGPADFGFSTRDVRIGARVLALLLFGAFWLLHRRYYRAMQLLGLEPPSPWLPAIACIVANVLLMMLLLRLLAQ